LGGQGGLRGGSQAAHAVGAGLFAAGIAASALRSLAGLVRPPGGRAAPGSAWLDAVLLFGVVGGIVVFVVLTDPKLQALNARYLLAGLTTVTGRGAVAVRPVLLDADGRLRPNQHFASRRWFGGHPFRFGVVDPGHPDGVDETAAVRTFGRPSEARDIGLYRV